MKPLRISTIQTRLHWEDIPANLSQLAEKMQGLKGKTDVIVLPEMFTTGFTNNRTALAEPPKGKTFRWLQEQAIELGCVVTGSYIVKEGEDYFNRLVWMQPDGYSASYDKRHLFSLAKEHEFYTPGQEKVIVHWQGWKICPLICYDLRFPVWSSNVEDYDLLIYVANWPERRANHWRALLLARAIENQSFTIGVNRVGTDGNEFYYSGDTSVIDYSGAHIYQTAHAEDVFTVSLDYEAQANYRRKLNFLADRDEFEWRMEK